MLQLNFTPEVKYADDLAEPTGRTTVYCSESQTIDGVGTSRTINKAVETEAEAIQVINQFKSITIFKDLS